MPSAEFEARLARLSAADAPPAGAGAGAAVAPSSPSSEERAVRALALLAARGVSEREAYPPLCAALGHLGMIVRPPLFLSFLQWLVLGAVMIAGTFGLCRELSILAGLAPEIGPIAGLQQGGWLGIGALTVLLAPIYAAAMRGRARKFGLPRYRDV